MFYDRFKEMCTMKGVSCNKAATEIGLSNSTATKWKKTGATPDARTISKIAEYFNVSADFLLTGEHKKPADHEISGLDAAGYGMLNAENRALIDSMIEKLLKSQSGE